MDTHVLVTERSLIPGLVTTKSTGTKLGLALAGRLKDYAFQRLADRGFSNVLTDWKLDIYTLDGEEEPENRAYMVRLSNPKGGFIELDGVILDEFQFPKSDYGFSIGEF